MDADFQDECHDLARAALRAVPDKPICGATHTGYPGLDLVCTLPPHESRRHENETGTVTWIA